MRFEDMGHSLSMIPSALPPLHLLAYSTLLGTELYQSFVMTKVCYQTLPGPAFRTLQKKIFPIYFQGQSALLLLVAATAPPYGVVSFLNSKMDWIPFVAAGICAGLNLIVYEPRTRQAMIDRVHRETRATKSHGTSGDAVKEGIESQPLVRTFSKAHAMCIHLNLISILSTLIYGWRLASKIDFTHR